MQTPKFSIIIPMYNVESFITRAIKSAINQSYENIEIICVDDCGDDKSAKIAKEFALQDSRIKVLQNPHNLGTFATRNNGALSANGEYLLFLDGDDFLHKDTCQKCYEILENANRGGQIDFIQFNIIRQWEQNGMFKVDRFVTKKQIIDDWTFEAMNFGKDSYFYTLPLKCIRREIYLKALEFASVSRKITVAEDILASMMILGVSKRIALLDDGLYYYCFNEKSVTNTNCIKILGEKVDSTIYVSYKLKTFANKKDKKYNIFLHCFMFIFGFHILMYQSQLMYIHYKHNKTYSKWLSRLLYSLQKKIMKFKRKMLTYRLQKFIQNNEKYFKIYLKSEVKYDK